jgi:hypothetical protein
LFLKGPGCQIARFHVLGVDAPERPAAFEKDGMEPDGAIGTLSLYHADRKVGEGRIKTQLAAFAVAGAGLYVGRHSGEPITDDYPGEPPYRFTGGTINCCRRQRRTVCRPGT